MSSLKQWHLRNRGGEACAPSSLDSEKRRTAQMPRWHTYPRTVPNVYLLIGFPGTGKYTVAMAMADLLREAGKDVRVVDNHYVANPIIGVVAKEDGVRLPAGIWPLVGQVREAVFTAIEGFAPKGCTFVFTNYVRDVEAEKMAPYVERMRALAKSRGGRFVLVALSCELEEQVRRVQLPERAARLKIVDPGWLRELHEIADPWLPDDAVRLDVTNLHPEDAAAQVLALGAS